MHAALTLGWAATTRATVTIGFIGGLTTYSSFNYDPMRLLSSGDFHEVASTRDGSRSEAALSV